MNSIKRFYDMQRNTKSARGKQSWETIIVNLFLTNAEYEWGLVSNSAELNKQNVHNSQTIQLHIYVHTYFPPKAITTDSDGRLNNFHSDAKSPTLLHLHITPPTSTDSKWHAVNDIRAL